MCIVEDLESYGQVSAKRDIVEIRGDGEFREPNMCLY